MYDANAFSQAGQGIVGLRFCLTASRILLFRPESVSQGRTSLVVPNRENRA
jgi:hypothetical protein